MNWLHFTLWVAAIYLLYYLVNILVDIAGNGRSPTNKSLSDELTFSEHSEPKQLFHEAENDVAGVKTGGVKDTGIKIKPEPEVMSSGGVSLKDIFNLARQESIIYTRPVSFS